MPKSMLGTEPFNSNIQVREKFLSLKKDAKPEIVAEFEEVR